MRKFLLSTVALLPLLALGACGTNVPHPDMAQATSQAALSAQVIAPNNETADTVLTEHVDGALTLQRAIYLAVVEGKAPEMRIALDMVRQAEGELSAAATIGSPEFSADSHGGSSNGSGALGKPGTDAKLTGSLKVTIWDKEAEHNLTAAGHRRDKAMINVRVAAKKVAKDVKDAYAGALRADVLVANSRDQQAHLNYWEKVATDRSSGTVNPSSIVTSDTGGVGTRVDISLVRSQQANARVTKSGRLHERADALTKLRGLIGSDVQINGLSLDSLITVPDYNADAILKSASVQVALKEAVAADEDFQAVVASVYPKITIEADDIGAIFASPLGLHHWSQGLMGIVGRLSGWSANHNGRVAKAAAATSQRINELHKAIVDVSGASQQGRHAVEDAEEQLSAMTKALTAKTEVFAGYSEQYNWGRGRQLLDVLSVDLDLISGKGQVASLPVTVASSKYDVLAAEDRLIEAFGIDFANDTDGFLKPVVVAEQVAK
jgi:outer membrane protein TolC